jgi:hypothetical protein
MARSGRLDVGEDRRGVERLARDFSVEITRQWPGENGDSLRPKVKGGIGWKF